MASRTEPREATADAIPLTRAGVEASHAALQEHLFETPLLPSPALSEVTAARVLLKAENIQRAGSFKVRGSVNKIRKLIAERTLGGVVAASAGNHAQGVAYAASRFGVPSTVFMPLDAPVAKRRATERLGATVKLEGRNYDESRAAALRYAESRGAAFIDGFDDWDVIEGQATIAHEIAQALGRDAPDWVLVPAGGGGLLAGVAFYLRQVYGERTRIVGVQCERAPALAESLRRLRAGEPAERLPLETPTEPTIADGVRIGRPGRRPFEVIRRCVDDVVCVGERSIYEGIVHMYEHSRLVVEGAGAVGVAAVLEEKVVPPPDSSVVLVVSGGNVDAAAMEKIIHSYLYKTGRRAVFRIQVKDVPGQLVRVLRIFEREGLNVAEIHQKPILARPVSPEYTVFDLCVETEGEAQIAQIVSVLEREQAQMRAEGKEPFQILQR